jgi:hypothetical protein
MDTMTSDESRPRTGRWHWVVWSLKAAQVRLRFFAALAVAFLVVGRWDVLRTYWDRWTAPAARDAAMGAVSADTEYFCPMDPGVLSVWPAKCPICFMALVRRKKGDMGPSPQGVVARVQISPARVQLAGIRTEPVQYRPLAREVRTVGEVRSEGTRTAVHAEVSSEEASWLVAGCAAEVLPDPPDGSRPVPGHVRVVEGGRLVVDLSEAFAATARYASVTIHVPLADREPFRSMPRGEPPVRPGEPRRVYVCPDHADAIMLEPGRCPKDGAPLDRLVLARNQRLSWWCPMHPKVVADEPGRTCGACGTTRLVPRIVSYCPVGEVLAVPEAAVIDTGVRTVVYIERMPGMFDGVEARLGPRCGPFYPVVEGLEAGQLMAAAGAFLVDAETRLNPSLAAGYFGAQRADSPPLKRGKQAEPLDLADLPPADRAAALAQATCPVTSKRLGSMGEPFRINLGGHSVFLCCEGCRAAALATPAKYLAKLKISARPAHHP